MDASLPFEERPEVREWRRQKAFERLARQIDMERWEESSQKIRAMYDAGEPYFTKEAFREMVRQFDEAAGKPNPEASVRGFNGVEVKFEIKTGQSGTMDGIPIT